MKVGIIYFAEKSDSPVLETARAVTRSLEKIGHTTELIDGYKDLIRVSGISYICFCLQGQSAMSAAINPRISAQLNQVTGLAGKRGCVFFQKQLFWPEKSLQRALRVIEAQGVFLRNSFVVAKPEAAGVFASRLDLEPLPR
jgi:hypothetical protein